MIVKSGPDVGSNSVHYPHPPPRAITLGLPDWSLEKFQTNYSSLQIIHRETFCRNSANKTRQLNEVENWKHYHSFFLSDMLTIFIFM